LKYYVTIGGRSHEVEIDDDGIRVDDIALDIDLADGHDAGPASLLIGGRSLRIVPSSSAPGRWTLNVDGTTVDAEVVDERMWQIQNMTATRGKASGPEALRAPMPGLVVKVEVSPGEAVAEGQGIVIVEAMKMENELKSASAGIVSRVIVEPGEAVEKDQVLVEFEPEPSQGDA
jgi:biotin carboxyl carrier protein